MRLIKKIYIEPVDFRTEIEELKNKTLEEIQKVCKPTKFLVFKFTGKDWEEIFLGTEEEAKSKVKSLISEGLEEENIQVLGLCEKEELDVTIIYKVEVHYVPEPPKPRPKPPGF